MTERILGFVLIAAGLSIIGYGIFASFSVFQGTTSPPEVFSATEEEVRSFSSGQEGEMERLVADQVGSIMPAGTIPKMLNLGSWAVFAALLFMAGGRVAGIGITLVKK